MTQSAAQAAPVLLTGAAWHFPLPYERPPLMSNDHGTSGNRHVVARLRADTRASVGTLLQGLRRHRPAAPLDQASVLLTWYPGRNRSMADPDNLGPTLKPCVDALRDAGWLRSDTGHVLLLAATRVVPLARDPWESTTPRLVLSLYAGSPFPLPHLEPAAVGRLARAGDGPT